MFHFTHIKLEYQFLPTVSEGWGKVMFSVCSHRGWGGTPVRSRWGRKVPPPPSQVRMGGAKVRTPPPPTKVGIPPGIGQHMEYLIFCGRYPSCVHVGGLSCVIIISVTSWNCYTFSRLNKSAYCWSCLGNSSFFLFAVGYFLGSWVFEFQELTWNQKIKQKGENIRGFKIILMLYHIAKFLSYAE